MHLCSFPSLCPCQFERKCGSTCYVHIHVIFHVHVHVHVLVHVLLHDCTIINVPVHVNIYVYVYVNVLVHGYSCSYCMNTAKKKNRT
jgi:hypothetical protein